MTAGCGLRRQGDGGDLHATASALLEALDVAVEREPTTQRSKSVEYVVADGTARGDLDAVLDRVVAALATEGWDVAPSAPLDAAPPGSPAHRVIARRDDVVAQALITGTLGTATAPAGSQWVQVSVAHPDDRLGWTTTP